MNQSIVVFLIITFVDVTEPAAFGSWNILVKLSGLPRVKVNQFLAGKLSYTKRKKRQRKPPRLQTSFIKNLWWMDSAQVDKSSSRNSNTKFSLVPLDVFSRFVRVQLMRKKNAKTTRADFIRICYDGSNKLSFRENCGLIEGTIFSEVSQFFVKRVDLTCTIVLVRRQLVSLNVLSGIWNF